MKPSPQADHSHRRAVIWIDHLTAKIFPTGLTGVSSITEHAHLSSSHLHHHANSIGSGHVGQDPAFLAAIAQAIETCNDVLGPGTKKAALMHHLRSSRPEMSVRMETSDHPTNEEIVAIGLRHLGLSEPRLNRPTASKGDYSCHRSRQLTACRTPWKS